MNQFMQTIRHSMSAAINRIGSFLHLSTMQFLFWGLGVVAVLVPTVAYALGGFSPAASSVTAGDRNVRDTTTKIEKAAPAKTETSLNADVNSTGSPSADAEAGGPSASSNNNQANIQLHINGQAVPVPPNGTVHKEITDSNGKTSVDFSVNSGSSGTSQSSSHTSMNIETNSSTNAGSADDEN